jgi:hypothetical protein
MRALSGVGCMGRGHMMTPIPILIVEDEPIISADLWSNYIYIDH